jgi:hypothetical protein
MRNYIQLVEHMADSEALNHEIISVLARFDKAHQSLIVSGLEMIKDAGPEGITVADWIQRMKSIYGGAHAAMPSYMKSSQQRELSRDELQKTFQDMGLNFKFCLRKEPIEGAPGKFRWFWNEEAPAPRGRVDDDLADVPQEVKDGAAMQVQLTSMITDKMKQAGTFTAAAITAEISRQTGMQPQMVGMLVQHTIDALRSNVQSLGGGSYRWAEAQKKKFSDYIGAWKDMSANGVSDPDAPTA